MMHFLGGLNVDKIRSMGFDQNQFRVKLPGFMDAQRRGERRARMSSNSRAALAARPFHLELEGTDITPFTFFEEIQR